MHSLFFRPIVVLIFLMSFSSVSTGNVPHFIVNGNYSVIDSLKKVVAESKEVKERITANNYLGAYYEGVSNYKSALQHLYASDKLNGGNYFEERIFCYNYLGYIYWHKSEYKIALYYHNKALILAQDSTISRNHLAFTYMMLGGDYYDLGDYEQTSKYYFQSLQLYEQLEDKVGCIMINNRLSKLYYKLKDYKRSREHAEKAQKINISIDYTRETAISFNCFGNIFIELGETDSALFYFKKTLFYFKKSGDVIGQAIASINLGDSYFQQYNKHKRDSDLDESYNFYQMSYMLNTKVDNKFGMIYGLWGVADIDAGRGQAQRALQNYSKALALANAIDAKYEQYNLCQKIYLVYEQQGQVDSSHLYLKQYVTLKNAMENEEQTKALLRQESKYEIAKKIDEKNAELKKDRLIEEEKSKRKNYIMIAVVLIMLVLAYTVLMSVKRLRTIQSQNNLINSINATLTMQKTEIMDSITYARRIQEAILPSENFLRTNLAQNFVMYAPKDIIAGDFYWMEKVGKRVLVAVADCTGHGVPGALVSVVCSNALNRTVLEFGITEPGKILDKTRELVLEAFSKSDKDVKDGMDISLASIDTETFDLQWSGANNPLWYVSGQELYEIAAHKQPIGKIEHPTPFVTHNLKLKKGDVLYLFTDGYADQFGGTKGKKFKYKPLKKMLLDNAHLSMSEQKQVLVRTLQAWKGNLEQVDDICVMGLKL